MFHKYRFRSFTWKNTCLEKSKFADQSDEAVFLWFNKMGQIDLIDSLSKSKVNRDFYQQFSNFIANMGYFEGGNFEPFLFGQGRYGGDWFILNFVYEECSDGSIGASIYITFASFPGNFFKPCPESRIISNQRTKDRISDIEIVHIILDKGRGRGDPDLCRY